MQFEGWTPVTAAVASTVMTSMTAKVRANQSTRVMTEIELSIGKILSIELYPAELPEAPRPLWAGFFMCPPVQTDDKGQHHPRFDNPKRITNKEWMRRVSAQLGMPEAGDEAHKLNPAANGVPGTGLNEECYREMSRRMAHMQKALGVKQA